MVGQGHRAKDREMVWTGERATEAEIIGGAEDTCTYVSYIAETELESLSNPLYFVTVLYETKKVIIV